MGGRPPMGGGAVVFDLTPLATGSRYRGIGTYAWDLGQALAALAPDDLDLRFLVGTGGRYELWTAEAAHDRGAVLAACGGDHVTGYPRYYMEKRRQGRRFLESAAVRLYHAPDPKGTPPSRAYRTVVTAHDIIPTVLGWPYRWTPRWWSLGVDRRRYLPHDHVITISEWTTADLVRHVGLPAGRATVVYHGVDRARFSPTDTRESDRPYFFYVGGFDVRKQVPELIEAFAGIAGEVGEDLVIAGRPYPSQQRQLEQAIARHGLERRVRLLGFVGDDALPRWYAGATAHVLPSRYEGFGLTALEAMACGSPVVTLRATSVPEVCGEAAEYAEDMAGIASGMRRVATSPERRDELRRLGLDRAATFTWRRAAEQTLDVYRRVLAP